MEIRRISTTDAIFDIFDLDDFKHLQSSIKQLKEARQDRNTGEWEIVLVNKRDFSDNLYTDPYCDNPFWIAGMNECDDVDFLQLVSVSEDSVELVDCEKRTDQKGIFPAIVSWVEENYPGRHIETSALNSELEQYYMSQGFERADKDVPRKLVKFPRSTME